MENEIVIHIEWDGPYRVDSTTGDSRRVSALVGPKDYGIYQIYGGHPVYGNTALLYIGLACRHFGERVPEEKQWLDNRDAGRIEVHVGRLAGSLTPDDDTWDKHIRLAERTADEYAEEPWQAGRRVALCSCSQLGAPPWSAPGGFRCALVEPIQ